MKLHINVSPAFRAKAARAGWAIRLFFLTYTILLVAAVGLTASCLYAAIAIVSAKPSIITLGLGIGLASLGVMVLIFLLKFVLASNKTDRSHLIEITRTDEPALFSLIDQIVEKVGTQFPKKVFLSPDVNAAVFYDSSFWSMILPVGKNLQIGLGLVNTVSKSELTAILSHEFGHFSQRSMKFGSFVHNVNRVLHNLLYENQGYEDKAHQWANASGYFSIFVLLALKIVDGIKWILAQMYKIVNKSYLALSREMEFNADEVAAHVTGYVPLKTSLLRMPAADRAFNSAIAYYQGHDENCKPENLYRDHLFVLQFLGEKHGQQFVHGLPQLHEGENNRYDKSRLKITDQWASHPSDYDRIELLERTGLSFDTIDAAPANELLADAPSVQKKLTEHYFREIDAENQWRTVSPAEFAAGFSEEFHKNQLPEIYRGYYDDKNPVPFEIQSAAGPISEPDQLFSDAMIDSVYTQIALQNDIATLRQVMEPQIEVLTFDYDGVRHTKGQAAGLVEKLEKELATVTETLRQNDLEIYQFFVQREDSPRLAQLYREFFEFDRDFDARSDVHQKLHQAMDFINHPNSPENIRGSLRDSEPAINDFKLAVESLMKDDRYGAGITSGSRESFEIYLASDLDYFSKDKYIEADLAILFGAAQHFVDALSRSYYLMRRKLLDYQAGLYSNAESSVETPVV